MKDLLNNLSKVTQLAGNQRSQASKPGNLGFPYTTSILIEYHYICSLNIYASIINIHRVGLYNFKKI